MIKGLLIGFFAAVAMGLAQAAGATATPILISQVPLTVAVPAHPQVIFAIGNSQSMDGSLSGAIMTGSGALGSAVSLLQNSASPVNFTVPAGFTPPVTGGATGASEPYTVTSGSNLLDNSPSRLNVAKAAVTSILSTFMASTDFALLDYQTSGLGAYATWAYYMSPPGAGFSFSNSNASPGSNEYVTNPCYGISLSATDLVSQSCKNLDTYYGSSIIADKYMLVGASSDDPSINDVLYSAPGAEATVCIAYNGLYYETNGNYIPITSPYSYFTLANYEVAGINVGYKSEINTCATDTSPTNAGYVPYSQQVMYVERGFGYYTSSESATGGNVLVDMQTAGTTPTTASINTAIAYFTPYLAPETISTATTEIKAAATQSPIAGLLSAASTYYATNPPSSNGCSPSRYVVLITDGLPTEDLSGNSWPPLGSAAAAGYGVTASFNSDGSLNTSGTNDQALKDVVTVLGTLESAGIKTYVVGLGAGVDPTLNPTAGNALTAMAIAGGTSSYFPATSASALTSDLQGILASILAVRTSGTAPAVSSSSVNTTSATYLASFETQDTDQDWTGNLAAWPISSTTAQVNESGSPIWSAQTQLDAQLWSTRLIATWDPVAAAGIPFEWTTSTTATSGIATSTTLGRELMTNPADTSGQDALQYLRGNRSLEKSNGGQYRNRTHVLADIVDSGPLYVGVPSGSSTDSTYLTFQTTYATRPPILYVGANDGMLHAFDATTGAERFAFIPNSVFANLINLTYPYYNEEHLFFVDGSPGANDVKFSDGTWHTVLAAGERAGGSSVFALDVTNPAAISTESALAAKVLWEFTDANMGKSYSTPVIAPTAAGYMAFFGNGYNSPTQTPYLYALNPQTGAVVAKLNLCSLVTTACDLTKPNGLSSVAVVNSTGSLSGNFDLLYAGDLQGNVWRVSLASSTASSWTATVLFQAKDDSSSPQPQPITTTPTVTLNPKFPSPLGTMVYVGTGQLLAVADLSSTQTQTMYGLYDSGAQTTPIARASLVRQTMSSATTTSSTGATVQIRTITANAVSIPAQPGWYVDFNLLVGERVITDPHIDSGAVVVVSNDPSTSLCTGGAVSWLNEFNYATGGSFALPQFDTSGSGTISSGQVAASGMLLSTTTYASSATIVSGSFGSGSQTRAKLIGVGTMVPTIAERGPTKQRTAWWEKR